MTKHEHEVDAVGATQMEYSNEEDSEPTMTDAGGFGPGIQPGDKIVISELSSDEPIRNCCARAVTVIETKMLPRGQGTNVNPSRFVVEYWTLDGRRLAEADKYAGDTIDGLQNSNDRLQSQLLMISRRCEAERKRGDGLRDKCAELVKHVAKLEEAKKRATKRARVLTGAPKKKKARKKARRNT